MCGRLVLIIMLFLSVNVRSQETSQYNQYSIYNNESKVVVTDHGSQIMIPENSFKEKGLITIKFREFISKRDMIQGDIPMNYYTKGGRHILESAGMYEIKAFFEGKEIQLDEGKKITVRMISKTPMEEVKLFYFNEGWKVWEKRKDNPSISKTMSPSRAKSLMGKYQPDKVGGGMMPNGIVMTSQIDRTGLYNFDRIIDVQNQPKRSISIELDGKEIPYYSKVFVIYHKHNTVGYYLPSQLKKGVRFLPNDIPSILIVTDDGRTTQLNRNQVEYLMINFELEVTIELTSEPFHSMNDQLLDKLITTE